MQVLFASEPMDSRGECTSVLGTSGSQWRAYPPREWTVLQTKREQVNESECGKIGATSGRMAVVTRSNHEEQQMVTKWLTPIIVVLDK